MATYSKVLKVESNFRDAWPWIYRLNCGHSFYGQKSKTSPAGDYPVHPQKMICKACNNTDQLTVEQLLENGWENTPADKAVSEQLDNGLHHTIVRGKPQRISGGGAMQIPNDPRIKVIIHESAAILRQQSSFGESVLRIQVGHLGGFNVNTFNGTFVEMEERLKAGAKRKYEQKVYLGTTRIRIYEAGPDQWIWSRHNIPASVCRDRGWVYRETVETHPLDKRNRPEAA